MENRIIIVDNIRRWRGGHKLVIRQNPEETTAVDLKDEYLISITERQERKLEGRTNIKEQIQHEGV